MGNTEQKTTAASTTVCLASFWEELAPRDHVAKLASDLAKYHHDDVYRDCQTMGELTATHIGHMLEI